MLLITLIMIEYASIYENAEQRFGTIGLPSSSSKNSHSVLSIRWGAFFTTRPQLLFEYEEKRRKKVVTILSQQLTGKKYGS